jgi:hypothetical protein
MCLCCKTPVFRAEPRRTGGRSRREDRVQASAQICDGVARDIYGRPLKNAAPANRLTGSTLAR